MENHGNSARYGYHVPHLLVAGFVGGAAIATVGLLLLLARQAPWILAALAIVVGLGLLVLTAGLGWLVYRGRPLITERMLDTVPWTGGERVLDVGCGPGLSLIAAAKRLTTGKAIGIDKWAVIHGETHNSRAITLKNAHLEGVEDRIEVHDGDAGAMPFADATFDVVVSSFVFHHLDREAQTKALSEITRVTRPGGRILITDDRTDRLASELRALGLQEVENRRVVFPIHLLSARKANVLST